MTESTKRGSEPSPDEEVSARIDDHDISVTKVASLRDNGDVTVSLTIRSTRPDPADIRVIDPLPEPVRADAVEFHPDDDPDHWTRANGAVVYEASIAPETERSPVYGIPIDGPSQLALFSVEPTLEVGDIDEIFDYWSDDGGRDPSDSKSSDSAHPDDGAVGSGRDPAVDQEPPGSEQSTAEPDVPASEAHHRDGSTAGQSDDRDGIGPDDASELDERHRSLREDVEALRAAVSPDEPPAADVSRIEAELAELSADVEDRLRSLSTDLKRLEAEVERGARWRALVQESIEYDPTDE